MDHFDVASIRARFPALLQGARGEGGVDLDGPAGTQVPDSVIEAMADVHRRGISNLGGGFPTSDAADRITTESRAALADLFNAGPDEITFGQNMTSLTFAVSRALSREWHPGDEIVVTLLDHDANVTPWRLAAADRGATVRTVPFDTADGRLDPAAVAAAVGPRTRLVAVTHASNALGTVPDVAAIVDIAHGAGALSFVDAVHFTPHRTIDVAALDTDFLVASCYKFFGPHLGVMYGKGEILERLTAYKVVPAPDHGPEKWETGTQSFESLAGAAAAVDYLASLGSGRTRRDRIVDGQQWIRRHEMALMDRFLGGAAEIPGLRIHGITAPDLLDERVPTFAVTIDGTDPADTAAAMRATGVYVRSGDYYAVGVMQHLGLQDRGGAVRIGFVHYTTPEEVDRTLDALARAAG
ncbi:MAG: cysteine desulfurase-like protein [Actinobacteria bacterium]|nr:cysteine desulfurase-like protein [Actinomycetota bacterium]